MKGKVVPLGCVKPQPEPDKGLVEIKELLSPYNAAGAGFHQEITKAPIKDYLLAQAAQRGPVRDYFWLIKGRVSSRRLAAARRPWRCTWL